MKINFLSYSIGASLSIFTVSPIALSQDFTFKQYKEVIVGNSIINMINEKSFGETLSSSTIDAIGFYSSGYCGAELTTRNSEPIANNGLIKENTPVNIEISILSKDGTITGSENIITYWKSTGGGILQAKGSTIFEKQNSQTCLITNVSIPGFSRAEMNTGNGWSNQVKFPNGDITKGPLSHPYTVAPILSSIFVTKMKEDLPKDYIDGIPNNIGDEDFRLVNSGNVENYSILMRNVLSGSTGINGSSDAGYSLDFLDLKEKRKINSFLKKSLILPAIELGIVSDKLNNEDFANLLRRYILAELDQDSLYEYGSEENIKSSIAIKYSNIPTNIQLDDGFYFKNYLKNDFLLNEFNAVTKLYEENIASPERLKSSFENPSRVTEEIYNLPFDFKQWKESRKGRVGDLYIYDNPYNKKTEIFRLKKESYGYFPTNQSSNNEWEFVGPRIWNTSGNKGDIYIYENPYNNAIDFFFLNGNFSSYFPIDQKSNNDWDFIPPYSGGGVSQLNISPLDAYEFTILANKYKGLSGLDLSKAILMESGNIHINEEDKIIYSTNKKGGLLGLNLAEIAAIAFDVEVEKLTSAQVSYTKIALENLLIDTLYGYGSINNIKSTVLNRIAYEVMDDALIEKLGTGEEPFILDELIKKNNELTNLNFEELVKDYSVKNFKLNGLLNNEDDFIQSGTGVQLFEDSNYSGKVVIIDESISNLSNLNFNDMMSSFIIPEQWKVEFYEHANFEGKKYTRSGSGNAPINDAISSVKILSKPEEQKISLFGDYNYSGQTVYVTESVPYLSNFDFNDKLSSFKIPNGWEVIFYEDENYKGRKYTRSGNGSAPINDKISSIKITKKPSWADQEPLVTKNISDIVYEGLVKLEEAQDKLSNYYEVVAYDNGEKIETVPITDELFARSQLFKYGLNAKEVDDIWKTYLKRGYLRQVSDSRITQAHLNKERELATAPAQDMWKNHFNKTVGVVAEYLSTLIDYKLKLAGYEPLVSREKSKTTLRLAHGMEVDERIKSDYFNGIWNNWNADLDNWVIYGPDINYSVKTVNNIFDFMAFSDVSFGGKLPYYSDQSSRVAKDIGHRDLVLHQALDKNTADKYCNKNYWIENPQFSLSRPGALGLDAVKYECGVNYITRHTNLVSIQDSFEYIVSEMMRTHLWDLKTVQTDRDILVMVLQMFVPIWGTVDSFEKNDGFGAAMGLFGDVMFFTGVASGVSSSLKPVTKLVPKPGRLVSKGVALGLNNIDDITIGAVTQVNKQAAKVSAKQLVKSVVKATFDEMNPLSGLGDLGANIVRKASKKMDDIRGGNKVGSLSPKVYKSRDLSLPKINQNNVDVNTGVGMPSKDRLSFSEVADRENIVIGVRPVDEKSSSLIESGLYGSKSLLVKSKSSDWGPHSGFIPVDQKYAKKSARNNVDEFNHHSQNSLDTKVAVEVQLSITDERVRELQKFGTISELKYDNEIRMYRANSKVDDQNVTFFYEETKLEGNKGWKVYVKEDGKLKPFNVMGSPDSYKAMTADYDLFTVMYNNADFGLENTLRHPKSWEEWKASVAYEDLSPEYKEMFNNKQIYDTKGAGTLGSISDRVKDLKNKINNQLGRGKGMEMVHHGADDANPYAVLDDNFPATFFVPKRLLEEDGLGKGMGSISDYFPVTDEGTIILRNPKEFANFHQVIINNHFTGPLNKLWAEQGGEILSRRARLSHVFLDARDQVAEALGSQLGNYKPYLPPKPSYKPNLDFVTGPIDSDTFQSFVYPGLIYDVKHLDSDFAIINNKYRALKVDGVYYKSEYDPVLDVHYIYDKNGNRIPVIKNENGTWVVNDSLIGSCTLPKKKH
ncbi:TPA: anthrax toxin-like adenylyl cyclase domain-containing protein [Vibrio vulnificus]